MDRVAPRAERGLNDQVVAEVAVARRRRPDDYRAEGPGKPPFVEVGQRVEPDTIVCIIEVMKMMNSVTAGLSGTIAEVVPDNAELVEYGQPLFRVQPA